MMPKRATRTSQGGYHQTTYIKPCIHTTDYDDDDGAYRNTCKSMCRTEHHTTVVDCGELRRRNMLPRLEVPRGRTGATETESTEHRASRRPTLARTSSRTRFMALLSAPFTTAIDGWIERCGAAGGGDPREVGDEE